MIKTYRPGSLGALLDVYENAIADFKETIQDIPDNVLPIILDPHTTNESCRSIQTILTHVVYAGFGYANTIHRSKGGTVARVAITTHDTVTQYLADLTDVFAYTESVFQLLTEDELRQPDDALKMLTGWGQWYDVEQLTEHAIVHILRHRRQIEKMKLLLP